MEINGDINMEINEDMRNKLQIIANKLNIDLKSLLESNSDPKKIIENYEKGSFKILNEENNF